MIYRIIHRTDLSHDDIVKRARQYHKTLPDTVHVVTTMRVNTKKKKESIFMMWGFGHGFGFLLPLLFLGKLFWLVLLAVLIGLLIRRFSFRYRQAPFYQNNVPPVQPSALEILSQRYARGEIDATTFEQMRERLQGTSGPRQQ
jgi:putative membrane protein